MLSTVDPQRFELIMVEMNGVSPSKNERVARRLLAGGMAELRGTGVSGSRLFVRAARHHELQAVVRGKAAAIANVGACRFRRDDAGTTACGSAIYHLLS